MSPDKYPDWLQLSGESRGQIVLTMAKFDPTDGFIVKGWMRAHLGLSGGEMLTYAIVYQFSQKSGAGVYIGGVPYLAAFIGCTQVTARHYLHELTERQLIQKIDATQNGVPFQHYKANPEMVPEVYRDTRKNFEGTPKNFEGGDTLKKFEVDSNNIDNKISTTRFVPPTLEMVSAYAEIRRNADNPPIDPQAFFNYNEASGWKVGNKPMKDWKAAFRTWEDKRRQDQQKAAPRQHTSVNWNDIKF